MRNIRRTPALRLGLIAMAALTVLAIVAPWIWGEQATALGQAESFLPASGDHWFGTDHLGRDVFARTMVATRLTLLMAIGAAAIAAIIGIGLGAAIWVSGPRVRELGQRLIDIMISYPAVIFALVVAAILQPGALTSVLAIGLATSPAFARLTTNLAASVATRDFVGTARLLGVPPSRVLFRHIVPNIAEPLLVLVSVAFTIALKGLTGLSFLGVGVQPPEFDWGSVLADGLEGIAVNPWPAYGPALVIVLAGLAGGLIGDGLAASVNPADTSARTSLGRAKAVLAVTAPPPPRDSAPDPHAVVEVRDLVVSTADGTQLVDRVSFTAAPREIVGVVGESGSGKSLTAMSLASLLADGLSADAATMRIGDIDLTGTPDKKRLASEIGIVYQDPAASFNPTLRMRTQLTEVLTTHQGVSRSDARNRAVEALREAEVSLPERRMTQHPHELSGGMRQRAMIASALLVSPKLLIADEPTTALDVTVQAKVLQLLKDANERLGTTILMISHDIGVISAICHRVLVMYAGRIVEELPVEDIRDGRAQHPYTQALLAATPKITDDHELAAIAGRPPQPAERPDGCAFAARCPLAREQCRTEQPALLSAPSATGSGRVACHALLWADANTVTTGGEVS